MANPAPPEWLKNFCELHSIPYYYDPTANPSWRIGDRDDFFHLIIDSRSSDVPVWDCTLHELLDAIKHRPGMRVKYGI